MMKTVKRRSFLKHAVTAVAGVAAFPAIVPSSVFGANAPGNRIEMSAIGTGSRGMHNIRRFLRHKNVRITAVCDVDKRNAAKARDLINAGYGNRDCRVYGDFRELLVREKPDAVTHALPDQWHAVISIACARAGCDIYGEKPLARTIKGGRAICNAVHRYQRVWQTGSWQRSRANFRRACELVRNGRIGKVTHVEVGLPRAKTPRPVQPIETSPPSLDWDMWLGPAPWRPYCNFGRGGPHWDWRWILDYSGGQLTDWAGHHIDIAHWGLGLDDTGPQTVEGVATYPTGTLYDVPTAFEFECVYKGGLKITVSDKFPMGAKWYGDDGWIHVWRAGLEASSEKILKEVIGPKETRLYLSKDHHENFVDCVLTRETTITPVETAHRSISVGLLGEIAMQTGRKLHWNPVTEEIANDPAASVLLQRAYREPWVL